MLELVCDILFVPVFMLFIAFIWKYMKEVKCSGCQNALTFEEVDQNELMLCTDKYPDEFKWLCRNCASEAE